MEKRPEWLNYSLSKRGIIDKLSTYKKPKSKKVLYVDSNKSKSNTILDKLKNIEMIKGILKLLHQKGFYKNNLNSKNIDGIIGKNTKKALALAEESGYYLDNHGFLKLRQNLKFIKLHDKITQLHKDGFYPKGISLNQALKDGYSHNFERGIALENEYKTQNNWYNRFLQDGIDLITGKKLKDITIVPGTLIEDILRANTNRTINYLNEAKNNIPYIKDIKFSIPTIPGRTVTRLQPGQEDHLRKLILATPKEKRGFDEAVIKKVNGVGYTGGNRSLMDRMFGDASSIEHTIGLGNFRIDPIIGDTIVYDTYDFNTDEGSPGQGIYSKIRYYAGKIASHDTDDDRGKIKYEINISKNRRLRTGLKQ